VRERLRAAGKEDLAVWGQVRALLREAVSESTFEIWLEPLELIAVDLEGTLVVSAPSATVGWLTRRFGRVLVGAAQRAGRALRVADEVERTAAEPLAAAAAVVASAASGGPADEPAGAQVGPQPCPADASHAMPAGLLRGRPHGRPSDQSTREPTYTSAYPPSYTHVYTQTKEAS
jgi:hypothetical protein